MTRPLEGVRVLELGNYLAAPFCGMVLADLGADVVKVENPRGGDYSRAVGPHQEGSPDGSGFLRLNRNKRSAAIDLKHPAGKDVFRALARGADALIENFRPGTMTDLELGYESLTRENPRLVYVALSGFGQTGRGKDRPGLDIMVQAESGLMSVTGEPEGEPVKVGVPVTDITAALYAALATTSGLRLRESTGKGTFVDIAMLEAAVSLAIWESGVYWTSGEVPRRLGTAHILETPYQVFATKDGHIAIGATTPRNWQALIRVPGLRRLAEVPEWQSSAGRRLHRKEIVAIVEEVTRTRTTDEWFALLSVAGVPCGRIRSYDEVFSDEALGDRGFIIDVPHPTLGPLRSIGSPLHFRDTEPRLDHAGPRLGEHTREVLREVLDETAIERLVKEGAIRFG